MMQYHWQIKNKAENLIIFFNGWSLDAKPFSHLTSQRFDVLMLYDYRNLTMPQVVSEILQPYRSFYLIAYSMGVWVSQRLTGQLPDNPAFSLAINGTLNPIHDRYGIPVKLYDQQIADFNTRTMETFYTSLFFNAIDSTRFMEQRPDRHWQDQLEELVKLKEVINLNPLDYSSGQFDAAIICNQDSVISARNQLRFWKNQCNIHILDAGHFPFYRWPAWEDLFDDIQGE